MDNVRVAHFPIPGSVDSFIPPRKSAGDISKGVPVIDHLYG